MIFAAILAFTFQCILVQSHVHGPHAAPSSDHAVKISAPHLPAGPDNDDPANCPLCQEMLHAGVYVTPAPILLSLPFAITTIAVPAPVLLLRLFAPSHAWQGRAPPHLG
jgi:hypothetical protein